MKYRLYENIKVKGIGPTDSPILIVGESPGNDETIFMKPFVGRAGEILNACLSRRGIPRDSVRIDNLSHYRPYNDKFENLLNTPHLESGIAAIHEYISTHKPIVVAALGNYPMHYLTGKGKKLGNSISGIGNWRGSILPYINDNNIKVVPLYHPAAVARNRSLYPIFDADIKKVKEESEFRGLNYTQRDIIINPTGFDLIRAVGAVISSEYVAIDIETTRSSRNILCISFSISPHHALVLSFNDLMNTKYIAEILSAKNKKIFHFGYFDVTQLKLNGFEVAPDPLSEEHNRIYFWDTYIASHVLEPELPHTLAFETSIRTREPYYKQEGKEESDQKGWGKKIDRERLYRYNGKDTACTFEVFMSQVNDFSKTNPNTIDTFNFQMSCIGLQNHISNSGMLIDKNRLKLLEGALIARWARLQYLLDGVAQFEVNVKSPLLKDWLYNKEAEGGLGMPPKYYQKKVTTNDDALVSLISWAKTKIDESKKEETKRKYRLRLNIIKAIREIREIRQKLSMYIDAKVSEDDRSRSSYKYGPDTGRWAAQKYVDGTGYNHQTHPRDTITVPDEDYEKYKNDERVRKEIKNDLQEEEEEEN